MTVLDCLMVKLLLFGPVWLFSFLSAPSHFSDWMYSLIKFFLQTKGHQRTGCGGWGVLFWGDLVRVLLGFISSDKLDVIIPPYLYSNSSLCLIRPSSSPLFSIMIFCSSLKPSSRVTTYEKMSLVFSPFPLPCIPLALGVKCWGIIFHSIFWLVVLPC